MAKYSKICKLIFLNLQKKGYRGESCGIQDLGLYKRISQKLKKLTSEARKVIPATMCQSIAKYQAIRAKMMNCFIVTLNSIQ